MMGEAIGRGVTSVWLILLPALAFADRKSTRLNSSHRL